ncbi:MAG: hypothetical protein ACD_3C00046G0001, partial [uncultured bacterium (gcode 4)]
IIIVKSVIWNYWFIMCSASCVRVLELTEIVSEDAFLSWIEVLIWTVKDDVLVVLPHSRILQSILSRNVLISIKL